MNRRRRERFDELLEEVIAELEPRIGPLLEEAPLIVEDRPSWKLLAEMGLDPLNDTLCGLHTGTPLTDRSVSTSAELPETIHIFREGIVEQAGGWMPWQDEDGRTWGGEDCIREEIRITVLHEVGHHFGLEEDDLDELGYA